MSRVSRLLKRLKRRLRAPGDTTWPLHRGASNGSAADARGVLLPSEEWLPIDNTVKDIAQLKRMIEAATSIPRNVQRLVLGGDELDDAQRIDSLPENAGIDLVIAVGEAYAIHRKGLRDSLGIAHGDVLVTHGLRTLEALAAPPPINVNRTIAGDDAAAELSGPEEFATNYYSAFEKNRGARLKELKRIRSRLEEGPVVFSTFNWGYRQMLENWAASCNHHGIGCRAFTLLFPTDEQADAHARKLGFQTYFDGHSYGDIPVAASKVFGDGDFRKVLFAKLAMTQDMLDIGSDVLRQDVDLIWRHDPRDYLQSRAEREGLDMLFMYDGPSTQHQPLHYNTGFVFMRDNPFTRYAWNQVFSNYAQIVLQGGEQRVVNIIMNCLRERGLRTERLAEDVFVNGHVISRAMHEKIDSLPESSAVIHASWTSNLAPKIEHMKKFGLWYL